MIQTALRVVSLAMHLAAPNPVAPVAPLVLAWLRRALSRGCTPSRQTRMTADNNGTAGTAAWGALIEAVAMRQDRAAFASLFEYFAPRIKAYMQRSGANEASAEELAQETMLTVWRKAALFDPASAGASAWIFTIARNLRIDAHRRASRDGIAAVVDVELEFQVDERPQPDVLMAASQSEQHVRSGPGAVVVRPDARGGAVVLRGQGARRDRADAGNSRWVRSNRGCGSP